MAFAGSLLTIKHYLLRLISCEVVMITSDWKRIREVFEQALSIPEVERSRFLDQVCGERSDIRAEVEKLLDADRSLDRSSFLDRPVWKWEEMGSDQQTQLPFTDEDSNKYTILKELGHGGMGVVYLAFSREREGEVAIKVIRGGLSKEDLRRFDDERRIHVKLDDNHNMVTFLGRGLLRDGRPYFVMKFVSGESLESVLMEGALPFQQVIDITNQLANALSFAHRAGVIHRDIKPSNIMLSDVGGELRVKVLDFGIAILRDSEDASTKDFTTQLRCTPSYASPEQAEGKRRHEIDHRSDIYSLGIVVYEMLTGKRPFAGGSANLVLSKRLTEDPPKPSVVRPDLKISDAVDRVIFKAMARFPKSRYDDAQEFARELATALSTEAPTAIGTAPPVSTWKKYLLPLVAVLLLAVAGGAGLQYCGNSRLAVLKNENESVESRQAGSTESINKNENENAPAENSSNGSSNTERIARDPIPPPGFDIRLLQRTGAREASVPLQTVFKRGDSVRWTIRPEQAGYLYIIFKGSSGRVSIFYPNPGESGSYDAVQKGETILFPQRGASLKFDGNAGRETYYFVFVMRKGEPLLAELEKALSRRQMQLGESEGKRLIDALQSRAAAKEPGFAARIIELQHR